MLEQVILIILAILFLIVLPIIATIKYWNFKPFLKYALILMWVSYSVMAYEVFFPRDSYYINHLNSASDINFSDNTKVNNKYTSLMNSKAQYYSCAVFEIQNIDMKILSNLKKESLKEKPILTNLNECSNLLNPILKNSKLKRYKKVDKKNYREWGFIENSNKAYVLYKFFGMAYKE